MNDMDKTDVLTRCVLTFAPGDALRALVESAEWYDIYGAPSDWFNEYNEIRSHVKVTDLREWLIEQCDEDPERMSDYLVDFVPGDGESSLIPAWQRCAKELRRLDAAERERCEYARFGVGWCKNEATHHYTRKQDVANVCDLHLLGDGKDGRRDYGWTEVPEAAASDEATGPVAS
jgi:hypothetical protein